MTIKVLTGRGSNRALATQLGVCEGTVRYPDFADSIVIFVTSDR
jgi:hypothetical protein